MRKADNALTFVPPSQNPCWAGLSWRPAPQETLHLHTLTKLHRHRHIVDSNLQNSSKVPAVPTFPMNPIGSRGNFWDRLHLNKPATRVCKWSNDFERRGKKIALVSFSGPLQGFLTKRVAQCLWYAQKSCECQVSDPSGLAGSSIPRYLIDWS